MPGEAMDFGERQVLVFQGVVVGVCNCSSSSATVVAAVMVARTGTVLINNPTIESAPATSVGRPDTVVPNTTSCWPVNWHNNCANPACNTVLTVVRCERANASRARVISAGIRHVSTPRGPSPTRSGGPTTVGVSTPANTSPQAVRAASKSRSASQLTNRR